MSVLDKIIVVALIMGFLLGSDKDTSPTAQVVLGLGCAVVIVLWVSLP